MNLASREFIRSQFKKYNFKPRKRWGQHFLIDGNVAERMVDFAGVGREDVVLEIGAGTGILTASLARKSGKVLAVEVDKRLEPILKENLSSFPNVEIVWGDVLSLDLEGKLGSLSKRRKVKLVGNLPYSITSPLIFRFLELFPLFSLLVIMVQKEVAQRISASPSTKDYGVLTISVQYQAEVENLGYISRNLFHPSPQVDSAILRLRPRKEKPKVRDEGILFRVVRGAFQQRRKQLLNSLQGLHPLCYNKKTLSEYLQKAGIEPTRRAESLSLGEYISLANIFCEVWGEEGLEGEKER